MALPRDCRIVRNNGGRFHVWSTPTEVELMKRNVRRFFDGLEEYELETLTLDELKELDKEVSMAN